jgi:hypothetical protein
MMTRRESEKKGRKKKVVTAKFSACFASERGRARQMSILRFSVSLLRQRLGVRWKFVQIIKPKLCIFLEIKA